MTFEQTLARLEAIIGELERDDVAVDRALGLFEEGIACLRDASSALKRVETRLTELHELADGTFELVDTDE